MVRTRAAVLASLYSDAANSDEEEIAAHYEGFDSWSDWQAVLHRLRRPGEGMIQRATSLYGRATMGRCMAKDHPISTECVPSNHLIFIPAMLEPLAGRGVTLVQLLNDQTIDGNPYMLGYQRGASVVSAAEEILRDHDQRERHFGRSEFTPRCGVPEAELDEMAYRLMRYTTDVVNEALAVLNRWKSVDSFEQRKPLLGTVTHSAVKLIACQVYAAEWFSQRIATIQEREQSMIGQYADEAYDLIVGLLEQQRDGVTFRELDTVQPGPSWLTHYTLGRINDGYSWNDASRLQYKQVASRRWVYKLVDA